MGKGGCLVVVMVIIIGICVMMLTPSKTQENVQTDVKKLQQDAACQRKRVEASTKNLPPPDCTISSGKR